MEKHCYGDRHKGVWYDGCRGRYIGFRVISLAVDHGLKIEGCWDENTDEFLEVVDQAEKFMQDFAQIGFYFGYHEDTGDWGLWKERLDG